MASEKNKSCSGEVKIVGNARFLTQPVTGVQLYARQLLNCSSHKVGATIEWVAPRAAEGNFPAGANVKRVGPRWLKGHLWEQIVVPFYARGKVLFCPANSAPLLSLLFGKTCITFHCLSFIYVPDAFSYRYRLAYRIIMKIIERFCDRVITVSNGERDNIVARYPRLRNRISVVENGAFMADERSWIHDRLRSRGVVRPSQSDLRILFVGRPTQKKNFATVVKVLEQLCEMGYSPILKVAGGVRSDLISEDVSINTELSQRIVYLGQIDDRCSLFKEYLDAHCLLFPSRFESSGLPPLEAMACGCVVVASDIPALRERCADAAILCSTFDVIAYVDAIVRLCSDSGYYDQFQHRGQIRADSFLWETAAAETFAILRQVSGECAQPK